LEGALNPSQAFGLVVRIIGLFGLFGWLAAFFCLVSAVVVLAVQISGLGFVPGGTMLFRRRFYLWLGGF